MNRYYTKQCQDDSNSYNVYDRETPHDCVGVNLSRAEAAETAARLNYGECETCVGTGMVLDGDDGRYRKCLDCSGTGIAYPS